MINLPVALLLSVAKLGGGSEVQRKKTFFPLHFARLALTLQHKIANEEED